MVSPQSVSDLESRPEAGALPAASSSRVGALFVRFLRWNIPFFSKAFRVLLGSDIYCKAPVSLILPHPYGITIHPSAVLGRNLVILQHVTIGASHDPDRKGEAAVIEDDVVIGAGAVLIGPIKVGRGAKIGANAVVTRDVPAGRTVVGINQLLGEKMEAVPPPVASASSGEAPPGSEVS